MAKRGNDTSYGNGRGNQRGPGNRLGPVPKVVRDRLRGSFYERVPMIESMADDAAISAGDRLRAIELMARYGLGTSDEQKVEHSEAVTPEQVSTAADAARRKLKLA